MLDRSTTSGPRYLAEASPSSLSSAMRVSSAPCHVEVAVLKAHVRAGDRLDGLVDSPSPDRMNLDPALIPDDSGDGPGD